MKLISVFLILWVGLVYAQSTEGPGEPEPQPDEPQPDEPQPPVCQATPRTSNPDFDFYFEKCSPSPSVLDFGYELTYDFLRNFVHIFYSDSLDNYNLNRTIQEKLSRDVYKDIFSSFADARNVKPLSSCPDDISQIFKNLTQDLLAQTLATLLSMYYNVKVEPEDVDRIQSVLNENKRFASIFDSYGTNTGVSVDLCRHC